jgi:hypothetical protein
VSWPRNDPRSELIARAMRLGKPLPRVIAAAMTPDRHRPMPMLALPINPLPPHLFVDQEPIVPPISREFAAAGGLNRLKPALSNDIRMLV